MDGRLKGYSLWGRKELDRTGHLTLSLIVVNSQGLIIINAHVQLHIGHII